MRDHRPGAAGKRDRSMPPALADVWVPHGIDATKYAMQVTRCDGVVDGVIAHPKRSHLPS
jgi:hypothetical protein